VSVHAAVLTILVMACITARALARGLLSAEWPALVGWLLPALVLLAAPATWLEEAAVLLGVMRAVNFIFMGMAVYAIPSNAAEVYLRFHLDVLYEGVWFPLTEAPSLCGALALKPLLVLSFNVLYSALGVPSPLLRACLVQGLGLLVAAGWEAHARANYLNHLNRLANHNEHSKPKAE